MFQRELTVRGRAGSTYLARTIAAVSAVVMLASILGSSALSPASVAGAGRHLFEVILQFLFVFAVFEGVRCTAFGIVGERKGGTLGLLFLTSMRGHDVLLGKVGGGMASTLSTLMVFSPLIAVPMLLGGVDLVTLLAGVSVLLLRLDGPLQAWGDSSRFVRRHTRPDRRYDNARPHRTA